MVRSSLGYRWENVEGRQASVPIIKHTSRPVLRLRYRFSCSFRGRSRGRIFSNFFCRILFNGLLFCCCRRIRCAATRYDENQNGKKDGQNYRLELFD